MDNERTPGALGSNAELGLVERLRQRRNFYSTDRVRWYMSASPDGDCQEAAERIEHLLGMLQAAEARLACSDDMVIAARLQERERCARICDEARDAVWPYHAPEVLNAACTVCENLANRIRGIGA